MKSAKGSSFLLGLISPPSIFIFMLQYQQRLDYTKIKAAGEGRNREKQTEGQSLYLFLHIFAYFFLPFCFLYMIFSSFHQVGTLSDAVSLHCRDCSTSAVSWMSFCQICEPTAVCICYPFWCAQNISQYSCTDMKDCFP